MPQQYRKVKEEYRDSDSIDAESLLSHPNSSQDNLQRHSKHTSTNQHSRLHPRWSTPLLITALLISHLSLALAAALATHTWFLNGSSSSSSSSAAQDLNAACAHLTSHDSPVTTDLAIAWSPVTYNGSFFHQTPFRGDASPETDAAWQRLGVDYRALRVRESEAAAAGITRDHVRIREEYGGGHPAHVEGLHHLHCLNLLRQGLVYNYDYYKELGHGAFKNEEPIVKYHITHCLDIIRQQLMCTVDTGVLGQVWWDPSAPKPFVDFNTEHQCKNFDAVRAWAEQRQLPKDAPSDFLMKPAGRVYTEIP